MKAGFIFIFSILLIFPCGAQQETENKPQGLWSFSRSEDVKTEVESDAAYYTVHHSGDIFLEGDSLWFLDYPCEKIEAREYSANLFLMVNDSTFDYNGERYSRQNKYDSLAIKRLKAHKFNFDCYRGTWNIIRSESGGDGTGVVFIYPFQLVDQLIIETDVLNDGVFRVPINGVEREFSVSIEHPGFPDVLTLKPIGSWKKKERFMWVRDWDLPPPNKRELRKIKRTKGSELEFRFSKKTL